MKRRGIAEDATVLLEQIQTIVSYRDEGIEKPHKGLLLLFVMAQLQKTGASSVSFADAERPLKHLISTYSASKQLRAEYPFWSLQNDRLWEVFSQDKLGSRKGKEFPPRTELIRCKAIGKLPFWVEKVLKRKPILIGQITEILLKRYLEPSKHRQILKTLGLSLRHNSAQSETTGLI